MISKLAIARALGVSHTCVSQVLNHAPNARISEATRRRVLETARSMGYVPRPVTRGNVRSSLIAYVLCSPDRQDIVHGDWHFDLLHELQQIALADDRCVTFMSTTNHAQSVRETLRAIDIARPLGIILDGAVPEELVTEVQRREIPLVVAGITNFAHTPAWKTKVSTVSIDVPSIVRSLLGALHSRGARQIAFVCGPLRMLVHQYILKAYKEQRETLGLACDPALIQIGEDAAAIEVFARYRALEIPFDGLLVANVRMASSIITHLHSSHGAPVDERHIAVVGNIELLPATMHGVTSCGPRGSTFCRGLYQQLSELLNYGSHKQQHVVIPSDLHEGIR